MAPTILVVGATGNTGRSVVETLSKLLRSNFLSPGYRVLALTRSSNGTVAQQLAQLPELTFHLAALHAGVKYVVRISTTAANVRPDCPAYYPRTHWAIEALLSSSAFQGLQWTSLQPNIFSTFYLSSAAELVKNNRKTGNQDTLRLVASKDAPVGIIDPDDVGTVAAYLLVEEDPTRHNKARYSLNGPEDITGDQIVKMVEDYIGTQVKDVRYKDISFIEQMAAQSLESKNVIMSIKHAPETAWAGECTASTTSKEVLELAAPKRTPAETFKALLED